MDRNPFSAGRWVFGKQFFGRRPLIANLLESDEPCIWLIGKRRVGKTSLLREMERVVNKSDGRDFALFWDMQGSYDAEGLFDSLYDALEDSVDSYPEYWDDLDVEADQEKACPQLLKKLARLLQRKDRKLILLIDEAEELINVGKQDPVQLSKLRRFMQTNRNTQTIMVSSPRLEQLGNTVEMETSPFLHGFVAFFLGNFTAEESELVLRQGFQDSEVIHRIVELSDGNPFELQLIAKNFFHDRDLNSILIQLETNPTLNLTIEVNFNLLSEDEKEFLKAVHCGPIPFQDYEQGITSKLVRMGYLKLGPDDELSVSSFFQQKWLSINLMGDREIAEPQAPEVVTGVVLNVNHKQTVLRRIVDIYRIFLELAQKGERMEKQDGCFLVSSENAVLLDEKALTLVKAESGRKPWFIAVEETTAFLEQYAEHDESWSLYRLHQMWKKGVEQYSEKEFLDLMMLIAEEAALG